MALKLLAAVFHENKQRVEVFVEDDTGRKRRVELNWLSKDPLPLQADWMKLVEGEIKFQDDEAHNKKIGRVLF
jgi:hypothetical protein